MKKGRRILSFLLALVMIFGYIPSFTNQVASVNAASELPKTSLRPKSDGTYMQDILQWAPDTSINGQINKASIERAERSKGSVVNPLAN